MTKNNYQIYVDPNETTEPNKDQSYYQWEVTPDNIISFQNEVGNIWNSNQLPLHYVQSLEDVQNNRIRMTMYPNEDDVEFVQEAAPKQKKGVMARIAEYLNNEVLLNKDNIRVRNYSKSMDRNPEFTQNNDMVANIGDYFKGVTLNIPSLLSPSHDIRLLYDLSQGGFDAINPFDLKSSWYGNNGVVPDKFANDNPTIATLINVLLDGGFYKTAGNLYKWGTTPKLIGNGAEAEVYSSPFSNYVIKHSSIPPEEMIRMNRVPGFAKCKYLGTTNDGRYIYQQKKLVIPKDPSKEFNVISDNLVKNNYKRHTHPNVEGRFFTKLSRDEAISDFGETGFGQIGKTRFLKIPRIIDMALQPIEEFYEMAILKKGGKLIPRNISKFYKGGLIPKFQKSGKFGWSAVKSNTKRYNEKNDHYLDELEMYARQYGFNDYQIAAMIVNAIHENQGSPLATKNRVGLWQGDKRQAAYLGNTVKSNVKAFKKDYDHGTWYSTYDKNGWDPNYYKFFKNATNVDDANYGMAAGYERFNGSKDRHNAEVLSRQKTSRIVYNLLKQGVKPSAMVDVINNYNFDDSLMA